MVIRQVTSLLLMLTLAWPGMPTVADCGCGGHPTVDGENHPTALDKSSCCSAAKSTSCCGSAEGEGESCCTIKPAASVAIGCCGKSGDACQCSDAPGGCQCGQNCQCGEVSEPAEEPTIPPSESESNNLVSQIISDTLVVAVFDGPIPDLRLAVSSLQTDFDCYSSTERCIKLCRFLR